MAEENYFGIYSYQAGNSFSEGILNLHLFKKFQSEALQKMLKKKK